MRSGKITVTVRHREDLYHRGADDGGHSMALFAPLLALD